MKPVICQHCGKTFRSKSSLNNHIKFKHNNIRCQYCKKEFQSRYYLELHVDEAHKSVTHDCKHCFKTFKSKYLLNIHKDEKHSGVTYDCVECLSTFKSNYLLQVHVNNIHNNLSYDCDKCSDSFKSKYLLKEHVDKTHNGVTHNCEKCSKTFKSRHLLKVHTQELHEGVTYNCELCSMLFKSRYYLMKHIFDEKHNGIGALRRVMGAKGSSTIQVESVPSKNIATKVGVPRPIVTGAKAEDAIAKPSKDIENQLDHSKTINKSLLCGTPPKNYVISTAVIPERIRARETKSCEPPIRIVTKSEPTTRDVSTNSELLNISTKSSMKDFETKQQTQSERFQDMDFGPILFQRRDIDYNTYLT